MHTLWLWVHVVAIMLLIDFDIKVCFNSTQRKKIMLSSITFEFFVFFHDSYISKMNIYFDQIDEVILRDSDF